MPRPITYSCHLVRVPRRTTAVFQSYALSAAQGVLAYLLSEGLQPAYAFDDDDATVLVNMFMFVYFGFGVVGGWFADHFGGNYPTELVCSLVWGLGSVIMCFAVAPGLMSGLDATNAAAPTLGVLFVGLGLVAVGYGVVNPLQSVLVADQFSEGGEADLVRSFSAYYLWCNVGNILGARVSGGAVCVRVARQCVAHVRSRARWWWWW